jgi:hypothetical protein
MIKVITIYICVVAGVAGLCAFGGQQYFSFYGSPVPQPESGEIVPIVVNHNKTVYITHRQDRLIIVGNAVAIGVVGVSLIGLFLLPVKRKTKDIAAGLRCASCGCSVQIDEAELVSNSWSLLLPPRRVPCCQKCLRRRRLFVLVSVLIIALVTVASLVVSLR